MSKDFNVNKFIRNRDKFGDQPKPKKTNQVENKLVRTETKQEANKESRGFMARKARFRRFKNRKFSANSNLSNNNFNRAVKQEPSVINNFVSPQNQIPAINSDEISYIPNQMFPTNAPGIMDEPENDGFSIDPREQFKFELKGSKNEPFFKFKRFLSKLETYLEIAPYWKSIFNIFTIVFSFSTVVFNVILILNNFGKIRSEVPFFYNPQLLKWVNEDKSFLFLFIIMSIIANLTVIRFSMTIYNFDKKLVYVMSASLILANILLTISFMQLLSFVLI